MYKPEWERQETLLQVADGIEVYICKTDDFKFYISKDTNIPDSNWILSCEFFEDKTLQSKETESAQREAVSLFHIYYLHKIETQTSHLLSLKENKKPHNLSSEDTELLYKQELKESAIKLMGDLLKEKECAKQTESTIEPNLSGEQLKEASRKIVNELFSDKYEPIYSLLENSFNNLIKPECDKKGVDAVITGTKTFKRLPPGEYVSKTIEYQGVLIIITNKSLYRMSNNYSLKEIGIVQ